MSIADEIATQRNRPMREKTRTIMRTLFMPEIKLSFGTTGMTHRAFLSVIASMFIQSGLLGRNHPAKSMDTIGSYGLRDLMGEAWYNLRNRGAGDIQQYGLFFSVFLLFALAIMMVVTFAAQMFTSVAQAAGAGTPGGLFSSPDPDNDIGLQLIKYLVGLAADGGAGAGAAERALGAALSMYSYGVLVIASFIIAWAILSIVVDTAATGKFFGGRHNPVWWPIRLIFALGLLIPLGHGFNAGQYMVIQIAKWGSNFASNVWVVYADELLSGGMEDLVANRSASGKVAEDLNSILKINICKHVVNKILAAENVGSGSSKIIRQHPPFTPQTQTGGSGYAGQTASVPSDTTYVRVGEGGLGVLSKLDRCGSVVFTKPKQPITVTSSSQSADWSFNALTNSIINNSSINDVFYSASESAYRGFLANSSAIAETFVSAFDPNNPVPENFDNMNVNTSITSLVEGYKLYEQAISSEIASSVVDSKAKMEAVQAEIKRYGWPVASLWYYIISSANSNLQESIENLPDVKVGHFDDPKAFKKGWFESKKKFEAKKEFGTKVSSLFDNWWNAQVLNQLDTQDLTNASPALKEFYANLAGTRVLDADPSRASFKSDVFNSKQVSTGMGFFKDKLKNLSLTGNGPHPIVAMAEIGRAMIAFASWMILASVGGFVALSVAAVVPVAGKAATVLGQALQILSAFTVVLVSPLIIGGVILSIILPMTPFIRFVFAISGWLIAIVEAIVMVPVMALGHLRTDGEGIMGPMLQSAYIMMLQLLLRPVLILLGLIFSMFLVSVTVGFVNELFMAMLDTIPIGGGANPINHLIRFVGFGVMYGVLMYGLINSSFKIVDLFPEAVVKYLGSGASGGMQDREDGNFDRAIIASAVFASNFQTPKPIGGDKDDKNPSGEAT